MKSLRTQRDSKYRLVLVVLTGMIVMLGVACGSDGPAKGPKLGTSFTLSVGSFVEVDVGDENVRVDFMGIVADSRCVAGVTCITAGVAEIILALTGEDGKRRSFPVNVPPDGSVTSDLQGFRLRLENLLPDPPPPGVTSDLYRAELTLTRLP